jgi:hypothetical protein
MKRKVLVSVPDRDVRTVDDAALRQREDRSALVRRAAANLVRKPYARPIDDPKVREAFEGLMRLAELMPPMTTAQALRARDRGRRF